jgi:hypothetical protein
LHQKFHNFVFATLYLIPESSEKKDVYLEQGEKELFAGLEAEHGQV